MDDATLFDEVLELTIRRQSGDATDEEQARLERLLGDSPDAVTYYVKIVEDGMTVREAAAARMNVKLAVDVETLRSDLQQGGSVVPTRVLAKVLGLNGLHYGMMGMAAAGLMLILSLVWIQQASDKSAVRTARVVNVSGVTWVIGAREFHPWSKIEPGDYLELRQGVVNVFISNGVDMFIEGPAEVRFETLDRVIVTEGKLAARVGPEAIGFSIETPHANVIDRGTSFGIAVDRSQQTDVVVYDGIVDLDVIGHGTRPRRRLEAGEAMRVDKRGDLSRIASVRGDVFLSPPDVHLANSARKPVIESVADNIRLLDTAKYNRVIPGGFAEDCRAYVDREHEWNGLDAKGLPPFLLGGDYVMTFNEDKTDTEFELTVTLARPAHLYVLIDNRVPPPDWLLRDFEDTTFELGLDEVHRHVNMEASIGAGASVDQVYSVWHCEVKAPGRIVLGPLGRQHFTKPARVVQRGMYGIVAIPLNESPSS